MSEQAEQSGVDRRTFLAGAGAGVVGAALLGSVPGRATAAEPLPGGIPFLHGYDAPAIKAWSPATDQYAKYFRSRVPLARRIPAFAATQARPRLDDRPRLMSLANDYMEADNFQLAHKYGYSFQAYALRNWQYVDLMGSWHGLPVHGDYGKEEPRFGVVNLPNPAWTDAAHRNGVKSLGCWFWPRPELFAEFVERRADGSFPLADKLVEMARYFGFDGYFINQEAQITPEEAELLHELFAYLRRIGPPEFHVQWYDSLRRDGRISYQNEFTAVNSPWIVENDVPVNNSIFLNYWWSDARMQRSHDYAESIGVDPYEVVFSGTEAGLNNFSQPYDPRWVFPEDGPARTSWAFLGAEMVWSIVPGAKDTVELQRPVYANERAWWSGPKHDPSRTGRSLPPTGSDKHNPERWDGVAHYIVEKSAIGSFPFVTRFNAGTGERFFVAGKLAAERPWYNIAIQDRLPTWQWWVRHLDGTPAPEVVVDYDYARAWDGGTSLRLSGSVVDPVRVRLFKTRLRVTPHTRVGLTASGDLTRLRVGLTFEDAPEAVTWLTGSARGPGWRTHGWSLARHRGRTIAALSLGLTGGGEVAVNVGELRLDDGSGEPPDRPSRFTVDEVAIADDVATVFLSWKLARSGVWYYDLFRLPDREWVGRVYDDVYVVPDLRRARTEHKTTIELVAVSPEGRRSDPSHTSFRWT